MQEQEIYTTKEAAKKAGCSPITARIWAFIGEGRRKNYLWTEADFEKFMRRPKPGRRWKKD